MLRPKSDWVHVTIRPHVCLTVSQDPPASPAPGVGVGPTWPKAHPPPRYPPPEQSFKNCFWSSTICNFFDLKVNNLQFFWPKIDLKVNFFLWLGVFTMSNLQFIQYDCFNIKQCSMSNRYIFWICLQFWISFMFDILEMIVWIIIQLSCLNNSGLSMIMIFLQFF